MRTKIKSHKHTFTFWFENTYSCELFLLFLAQKFNSLSHKNTNIHKEEKSVYVCEGERKNERKTVELNTKKKNKEKSNRITTTPFYGNNT